MRPAIAFVLFATACNSPSKKSIDAYHDAQKAALGRVADQEKVLERSIAAIRAGRWTPRPDLGACVSTLPPAPAAENWDPLVYSAWVMDDPNPNGVSGWDHLGERALKHLRESIGDPTSEYLPDSEKSIASETARIAALDPLADGDFAILFVDEVHRPKETGPATFDGGDERGRAWVFSMKKGTVVCASTFESRTPHEVLVKFFLGDRDQAGQVDSKLMLSLRESSIHAAAAAFVAAGPPK